MKKRILFGLVGLVMMAAAAIVTASSVNANSTETELLSQNLEALTSGEADVYCTGPRNWGCCQCSNSHPCRDENCGCHP